MSEADDEEDADEAAAPIVESLFVTKHLQDSTTCSRRRRSSNRPVDVEDSIPPIAVDVAGATRKHRRFRSAKNDAITLPLRLCSIADYVLVTYIKYINCSGSLNEETSTHTNRYQYQYHGPTRVWYGSTPHFSGLLPQCIVSPAIKIALCLSKKYPALLSHVSPALLVISANIVCPSTSALAIDFSVRWTDDGRSSTTPRVTSNRLSGACISASSLFSTRVDFGFHLIQRSIGSMLPASSYRYLGRNKLDRSQSRL